MQNVNVENMHHMEIQFQEKEHIGKYVNKKEW